jgi:hypothetical protein
MMGMMLDSGAATMNDWVGIGNIPTWIEDACWCGFPAPIEYLLQRGADTLRADTTNPAWPNMKAVNALAWCVGTGTRRQGPDSAEAFKVFIKYFELQVNKTVDPRKTLNEQVATAGGTGRLVGIALGNKYYDACLGKVTRIVKSGQDMTEFERQNNWQNLLSDRSNSNPTCVAYIQSELEERGRSTPSKQ